jgi:superfamily I DNA and/or RNA helicase
MIVSIGYGRNQKGILYQFFGPILRHGGERRLNVLMSRARKKIIVITSLKSSDLKSDSDNKGLQIFKSMLQWIENPSLMPHNLSKNNSYHNYLDYFYRLN